MTASSATPSSRIAVAGIVLAAGLGRRWHGPQPKQLYPVEGVPLVRRTAEAFLASSLRRTLVVVGHARQAVVDVLDGLDVEIVVNPDYRDGQSTSIRQGLRHVPIDHAAVVIGPCDQPWLDASVIDALIARFLATGAPAVVPTADGARGAPTLIARPLFPDLARLEGDVGARRLLAARDDLVTVPLTSRRPLDDVDTLDDLASSEPHPGGRSQS